MKTPTDMQKIALLDEKKRLTAGAGSGKTLVLTHRYDDTITKGSTVSEIVAFTFTNKAASEMRARVVKFALERMEHAPTDEEYTFWWQREQNLRESRISTIHAFCGSILREYPLQANLSPAFKVLEENEAKFILDDVVSDIWLSIMTLEGDLTNDQGLVLSRDEILNVLERIPNAEEVVEQILQNREVLSTELLAMYEKDPDEIATILLEKGDLLEKPLQGLIDHSDENENKKWELHCSIVKGFLKLVGYVVDQYEKNMLERGFLDFNMLQLKTLDLLENEDVLARVRCGISALMVDEFQDTNPLQWNIIKKICGDEMKNQAALV